MSNKPRYERRQEQNTPARIHEPEEIVTGIPASPDVPAGSPQYAAFEDHVAKLDATSHLGATNPDKIEDRDNRGDGVVNGKYVERLPIHEVDALAEEMAARFAHSVDRVSSQLDGDTLTVTIVTRHGTARESATVKDWTKAGVNAALKEIEGKLNGDIPPGSADDPNKKLADAVREAVKG